MNTFLLALQRVSRLNFPVATLGKLPVVPDWQLVLARGLIGFVWGLAGALVIALVPNDSIVAALLGTLAVMALRLVLSPAEEQRGVAEICAICTPKNSEPMIRQAISNGMLCLRPLCIFVLLMHHNWLWLCGAGALSMAVQLGNKPKETLGWHWGTAFIIALAMGALSTRIYGQQGMFIMSLLTCALCWSFPAILEKVHLSLSKQALLVAAESLALILGLLGQAM